MASNRSILLLYDQIKSNTETGEIAMMKVEDWVEGRDIDITHMATTQVLVVHPLATSPVLQRATLDQNRTQNITGLSL